jgi:pimeloyl-ACP methyl ester carboxylesterase
MFQNTPRDTINYSAPTRLQQLGEARALLQFARLGRALPRLLDGKANIARPILVIPGFATGDGSTWPLRAYLSRRGHACVGWNLGTNNGDVKGQLDAVTKQVELHSKKHGAPCVLLGWSLGGVLAREVARDRPELVRCIVTFGTPLTGPRPTRAAGFYGEARIREIEAQIAERAHMSIAAPITAIYTKQDGVVDYRTCIDSDPKVQNLEVHSTHVGLGFDPDVWRAIVSAIES